MSLTFYCGLQAVPLFTSKHKQVAKSSFPLVTAKHEFLCRFLALMKDIHATQL